jgi:hypothetical protein
MGLGERNVDVEGKLDALGRVQGAEPDSCADSRGRVGGECRAWEWSVRKDSGIEHTGACGHGFGVALVRLSPRFVVFRARVLIMQLRCQVFPVLVAGEVILFCRREWNAQVGWRSTGEGFGPCQPDLPGSPQPAAPSPNPQPPLANAILAIDKD